MKTVLQLLIFIFFTVFPFFHSFPQVNHRRDLLSGPFDYNALKAIYKGDNSWKPFPFYNDRKAWQDIPEEVKDLLIKRAQDALDYQWPILPATLYLEYSRNGNRTHFQNVYFERRAKLADLVIGEMIEGDGEYLDQIINGIWAICEESSWTIPAHIGGQKEGFTPLPEHDENVVALFSSETGSTLSWTYYFLKNQLDKVTPVISKRIEYEVNKRILTPVLERDDFWWMGLGEREVVNNWNPWIISNWITCDLIMEKNPDRKAKSLAKALVCLDKFLNFYPDDGGCDEGPSYWGHAGGSLFDCLDLLYTSSNGKIDIYDNPLIKNIASYIYKVYIADDYFINFADAPAKLNIEPDIVYRYGKKVNDPVMMGFAALFQKRNGFSPGSYIMGRKLNSIFSFDEITDYPPSDPLIADFWLPDTQVFGARSEKGSTKGLYVAGKGGHNAESHNHNDVGNYIVYYNGRPVIVDIGVEEYRRETFSADRYTIWTMQSQYHTLPTINGVMQKNGRDFHAEDVSFSAGKNSVKFSLDIADAYPEEAAVKYWKRSIDFRRGKSITVTEEYGLNEVKGDLFLSFMTPCNVKTMENEIILTSAEAGQTFNIRIDFDSRQIKAESDEIKIDDRRLNRIWGNHLNRVRMVMKDPAMTGRIKYVISPE